MHSYPMTRLMAVSLYYRFWHSVAGEQPANRNRSHLAIPLNTLSVTLEMMETARVTRCRKQVTESSRNEAQTERGDTMMFHS